jgi:hypothetical protein
LKPNHKKTLVFASIGEHKRAAARALAVIKVTRVLGAVLGSEGAMPINLVLVKGPLKLAGFGLEDALALHHTLYILA